MSKHFFAVAFAIGLAAVAWVGLGFVGTSVLALAVTALIAGVYLLGAFELRQFRAATGALAAALDDIPQALPVLGEWIERVPASLRSAVRLRVEGERVALPGPALAPYLVGLLVMLGMLGTFLGMVLTFKGAVFALEGSSDLQAMRSALAEPIKGLGLSFGTSVAGVAASAMLGLMSAISRRERLAAGRQLDARIAGVLRPFSLAHQRAETLRALQAQAGALPAVADQLAAMMERIEQRSRTLDARLLERHERLQGDVTLAYTGLAAAVGSSLRESLSAGARTAAESITPVVASAMAQVVEQAQRLHARVGDSAQAQVDALSREFGATAREVSTGWSAALAEHARTSDALAASLQRSLASFTDGFSERSTTLLASVQASLARSQSDQAVAEQQRLQAWTQALQAMAGELQGEWRRLGDETIAHQQAVCRTLEHTAGDIAQRAGEQAGRTLADAAQLLARSEELVRSRTASEAQWVEQHGARMDQLAALWRTELQALRQEESERGLAAVDRLGELQGAVAQHLATLGAQLEAPITRLLHTAAEVPRAATGVLAQLREEMSRLAERDNAALQERTQLLERIGALLHAVDGAAGEQRAAIGELVASASGVLQQAGSELTQALQVHAGQAADMAVHANASAVELASLGEAFGTSVQQFQAGNDKLVETLQRIETSINRSTARSDEQLAYYVAQAREVIDLSIASQQGLVEHLGKLQARPVALVAGGRG